MSEKKILVARSSMPPIEEYVSEIQDMWETHWLTNMGVKHKEFQRMLKEYLGVEKIELFTNGHMALELTLQAMQLEGEVITTPYTFASTTHAIVRNGLTPVFCDINLQDYTIDVMQIEKLISERTCAIVPVHVYGNICQVEEIQKIADKYHLKVIYDAAHTFGETYKGQSVGCYGDASCYSFHATKVFHTIEGGATVYREPYIGERLFDLKNFGIHGPEEVNAVGANAKMNEFCAAMGICNLRHLDDEIAKRKKISDCYRSLLENVEGIQLNVQQKDLTYNYAYFPVLFDKRQFGADRNQVFEQLETYRIYARKYFYPLTSRFSCYQSQFDSNLTPNARYVSENILTLPLYADLEIEQVERICDLILKCKR